MSHPLVGWRTSDQDGWGLRSNLICRGIFEDFHAGSKGNIYSKIATRCLGKFSESFQNIKPELLKELQSIEKSLKHPYSKKNFGHDSMGFLLWKNVVSKQVLDCFHIDDERDKWMDIINCFMQAANGHHGLPVKQGEKKILDNYFTDTNKNAAIEFVEEVINLFSLETFFKTTDLNCNYDDLYKKSTTIVDPKKQTVV